MEYLGHKAASLSSFLQNFGSWREIVGIFKLLYTEKYIIQSEEFLLVSQLLNII